MARQAFGDRIRQARLDLAARRGREVRILDVAEAVGVTGSAVSQWESGATVPKDLDQIAKAAAFLGVPAGWLAFGDAPLSAHDAPQGTEMRPAKQAEAPPAHRPTATDKRAKLRRRKSG